MTEPNTALRCDPTCLEAAEAYQNPRVVTAIRRRWNVSETEAEALFLDVRRCLWLSVRIRNGATRLAPETRNYLLGLPRLAMLDEVWHAFILCTRDYMEFCSRHLGLRFVHHQPTTRTERDRAERDYERDPDAVRRARTEDMKDMFACIVEELGEAILTRLVEEVPRLYSHLRMAELRRPLSSRLRVA